MPRPREVLTAFESLIAENKAAAREIAATGDAIGKQGADARAELQDILRDAANRMLRPMDRDALAMLAKLTGEKDIATAYDEAVQASQQAQVQYDAFIAEHGGYDANLAPMEKAQGELKDIALKMDVLMDKVNGYTSDLLDAADFMARHSGKQGVKTEADAAYFNSKKGLRHVAALLFDSHYREGRAILKTYAARKQSLPDMYRQREAASEEFRGMDALRAEKQDIIDDKAPKVMRLRELGRLLQTRDEIHSVMAQAIVNQLNEKPVLDRAAIVLKKYVGENALEAFVKAEACAQMEERLSRQTGALEATTRKLEKPLYKLRRARSSGQNVKVDVKGITEKVQGQRLIGLHLAQESAKAAKHVDAFSTAGPRRQLQMAAASVHTPQEQGYGMLDMLRTWMIFDMLTHSSPVDAAAVQMSLGIPEEVASEAAIDLNSLSPQINLESLKGIDGMADLGNLDVSTLDSLVGNIDVSVPDVSVPDVSLPDFSVDTGSFSSDSSFGGGFD